MQIIRNTKGAVLAEALVAVVMIASAAMIIGGIYLSSSKTTVFSRDRMLASNLVAEGIDGLYNIRNTNWILKSDQPDCWLNYNYDDCVSTPNPDHFYTIDIENDKWSLSDINAKELDLSAGEENMSEFRLFLDSSDGFTNYTTTDDLLNEPSPFFRQIDFLNYSAEAATVEIKVQWMENSKIREHKKTIVINNY